MTTNKKTKKITDITLNYSDVDINNITISEPIDGKKQKISFTNYKNSSGENTNLFIQLPWFKLNYYGIPNECEFYDTDSSRMHIKIPLNESIPEIKKFCDFIKKLDEKYGSEIFKNSIIKEDPEEYEYVPVYRISEKKKKTDTEIKPPYIKLAIDTSYPGKEIRTTVFSSKLVDGKRIRERIEGIQTIDDFRSHVKYMSNIHPIVRPSKMWFQLPNKKDPTYGLTFKVIKIEVESSESNGLKITKEYLKLFKN